MCQIPLRSAGAIVKTQLGRDCHCSQLRPHWPRKNHPFCRAIEAYHHQVHKSIKVGGLQSIHTFDGYILPLNIRMGLPYLSMHLFTDEEWDSLPHIILTSEREWDPSCLDRELDSDEKWFDVLSKEVEYPLKGIFNLLGEYEICTVPFHDCAAYIPVDKAYSINVHRITKHNEPNYESLRPKFGWLSTDIIQETFCNTTQYIQLPGSEILKKRYKSPCPALNVFRREEPVAMDTVYSDKPAIDNSSTCAQLYVGTKSTVADVYGMKSEKQLVNTLEDNICEQGAMKLLISDSAQSEISSRILDVLHTLCIPSWQSSTKPM
jgi:hypothetical protein